MRSCRFAALWGLVLLVLASLFLSAVAPGVAVASTNGEACQWHVYYFEVLGAPSPDMGGGQPLLDWGTRPTAPTNSEMQQAYASMAPGGDYTVIGMITDDYGNPVESGFVSSGSFPGGFIRIQPCSGDTKFSGDLSLGTAIATYRPVATPKQELSSLMAQLELRADFKDFSVNAEVRHPFFNDRWGYWRAITARFGAGVDIPVGRGGAALFARYERHYHNDFEWGWGGIRFPLRF